MLLLICTKCETLTYHHTHTIQKDWYGEDHRYKHSLAVKVLMSSHQSTTIKEENMKNSGALNKITTLLLLGGRRVKNEFQ